MVHTAFFRMPRLYSPRTANAYIMIIIIIIIIIIIDDDDSEDVYCAAFFQ